MLEAALHTHIFCLIIVFCQWNSLTITRLSVWCVHLNAASLLPVQQMRIAVISFFIEPLVKSDIYRVLKESQRQMLSFIFGHGVNTQQALCQEVQKSDYRRLKMPTAHTVTDACCLETNLTPLINNNIFFVRLILRRANTNTLYKQFLWELEMCGMSFAAFFLMLWNQTATG